MDAIINHMAGTENSGHGSGGTQFDGPTLSFPGVPYSAPNFNPRSKCPSGDGHVNNYGDPNNVRNCYLLSLADLDQVSQTAVWPSPMTETGRQSTAFGGPATVGSRGA